MPRRLLLAIFAAALVFPASASATYTGTVSGTSATLTGDDAGDTLTLTVSGANLAHNLEGFADPTDFDNTQAGIQAIPAGDTAAITVNAGGGDDTVTASAVGAASIGTFTVDGGAGNDLITGTLDADALRGGDGNDRVIGAVGADDLEGGAGNDQLVWNNGDGSDTMDGDAGNDEVEVNGAATAGDQFTIDAAAPRVTFRRVNLVNFTLDVSAERMTVNGLGGNDTMTAGAGLAPLILLTLNGGVGTDAITGGDGADLIAGGEESDTLTGGPGDDRILGDRGGDTMAGGAGDDTLVWNDGDGSDTMNGDDGDDAVEVNGSVTAGDAFTLAVNGARAKFDRTNLVPFTLDIGSTETLQVNGRTGDDTFSAAAGTDSVIGALLLAGGSGNDTLAGGASEDVVAGGSGNDTLDGGGGADAVRGGPGDDVLALRDGAPDLGTCDGGNDRATADAVGIDATTGCETLDQPAGPDVQATAVTILTRTAKASRGRRASVRVRLSCPATETGGCIGRLTLRTAKAVRLGRLRAQVVLGSRAFNLRGGQSARVRVRLATGYKRLAKRKRIAARSLVSSRDASGNRAESSRRLTIKVR